MDCADAGRRGRTAGTEAAIPSLTDAERKRFHGLLRLAAESPFAGERANAFAAATRLAARHGLTVEEAAAGDDPPPLRSEHHGPTPMSETMGGRSWFADYDPPEVGRFMHLTDIAIRFAKQQREAALAEARARGIAAKDVTPFLLAEIGLSTAGAALAANIALVRGNARLAAAIAVELSRLPA